MMIELTNLKQNTHLWIHRWLRCCLHCGAGPAGDSLFCGICENFLWQAHPENHHFSTEKSDLPGIALFEWHPDQDRRLSKLMLQLKGGRLQTSFDRYAEKFVSRMPAIDCLNSILVPCPGKSRRLHSQALARAFSQILDIPIFDLLEKNSQKAQKGRTKRDREKTKFTLKAPIPSRKHVIFIDDIVTSGSTAHAAAQALKSTPGFQVWCLARRRQLATELSL